MHKKEHGLFLDAKEPPLTFFEGFLPTTLVSSAAPFDAVTTSEKRKSGVATSGSIRVSKESSDKAKVTHKDQPLSMVLQ